MWASAGPGLTSSSPNQWKSDGRVESYNSISARSPLTKTKKNIYRERSKIEIVRVSAKTGSVPCKMAEARQSVSAPCWNRTLIPALQTALTTKPLVRIDWQKITVYDSSYFATCNRFFLRTGLLYSDFSS